MSDRNHRWSQQPPRPGIKLRRNNWETQKIKGIKELTAKGSEPEIGNIIANHKKEINDDIELDIKKIDEKDDAVECEKNFAVQRLRNQNEESENEIAEERRRWNEKLNNEIKILESLR